MPELTVRPALVSDAREIAQVQQESWVKAYAGLLPEGFPLRDEEERIALWAQRIVTYPCHTLVAEVDKAIVGVIFWVTLSAYQAEIGSLYLHPFYWGQGIGRRLLERVLADLRQEKLLRVSLWVMSGNIRAERFYLANGFQYDGQSRVRQMAKGSYRQRQMVRSL
jgi:Acetyltransferases, including N-acetylases of ribosomal proteins